MALEIANFPRQIANVSPSPAQCSGSAPPSPGLSIGESDPLSGSDSEEYYTREYDGRNTQDYDDG